MIDNVEWRLKFAQSKIPEIEVVNFNEHKDVAKRINEMTAPSDPDAFETARPAGLGLLPFLSKSM